MMRMAICVHACAGPLCIFTTFDCCGAMAVNCTFLGAYGMVHVHFLQSWHCRCTLDLQTSNFAGHASLLLALPFRDELHKLKQLSCLRLQVLTDHLFHSHCSSFIPPWGCQTHNQSDVATNDSLYGMQIRGSHNDEGI